MAREKEKRSCGQVVAEWRAFLWDPRTRQFLGRTGSSWGLILLFYLVFYGFLAGLFALTMWVMLQSVDPHVPKYQDRLLTPGLMIRPCAEGLDVTFNVSQSETWHQYVRALHQFLERTGRRTGMRLGGDWDGPNPYWDIPNPYWDTPNPYWDDRYPYWDDPNPYWDDPYPYWDTPNPYWDDPNPYWDNRYPYWDDPNPYWDDPYPYWDTPNPYWDDPYPYWDDPYPYWDTPHPYWDDPYPYWDTPNPYWDDRYPYWDDRYPYWDDPYPYWDDRYPYWDTPHPYWDDPYPYWDDRYPYWDDPYPYWDDRYLYWDDPYPYWDDRYPYWDDPYPYWDDRYPYWDTPHPYRDDRYPYWDDRYPYWDDSYNDSVQAARNAACPAGRYNEQPDDAVPNYPKRACRFNRSLLGPCAGLGAHGDYGYGSGQPCVLVKVNRVINFFPGKNKSINIVCAAKVNYTQPVVAVQFSNATANVDHHVECRLNAAGLRTDDERDKFAGRVAFRLRINRD
ncbi:hypothetical protein DUI87_00087 [Hirundo rustica rustica]|uniref:Sodium/potassium-transporting ATPase subunit beta-2 n=1 Tax=Hirundo rustica rustica TaxID=333673 RepID=A0A3M0LCJ4_HIRRU|nr:hypothetical protein DUI87_00087 [Hirundo rustica rustica]